MFSDKHPSASKPSHFYDNPWFYFVPLTMTNFILSYVSLSFSANLFIGVLGWGIPTILGFYFFARKKVENQPLHLQESLPSLSLGWWLVVVGLALIPRFYLLLNNYWPVSDEGLFSFLSLELSREWEWILFFSRAQAPPIFNWVSALYFDCFTPSLFILRLFLFALAVITPIFIYTTGRHFFSKSIFLFCFLFFSFGFYSLYTYKYFLGTPLTFLVEMMTFYFLGSLLKSNPPERTSLQGWQLGLMTGLGFWMAIQWPLVSFLIAVTVIFKFKKKAFYLFGLWLPIALSFLLFCLASYFQKNGQHMTELLALPGPGAWQERINDSLYNWTSLFWGCDIKNSYGPVWGGMMDPISGSLLSIGFFELVRHRKNRFCVWILFAFFLFMIPGLITNRFEIYRNSLTLPLLILICALGLQSLVVETSKPWRFLLVSALLIPVAGLDMFHMWKTYQPGPKAGSNYAVNSPLYSKAFDLLKENSLAEGPGYFYWGFNNNIEDPSLDVLTYGFNAAENPKIPQQNIQWGAFITNANYKPFLSDLYPMAKFHWLAPDDLWNQGGLVLVIVENKEKNWEQFKSWNNFNTALHSVTNSYLLCPFDSKETSNFEKFLETEKYTGGDRFLESVFYEKLIYFRRHNPNHQQLIDWINQAVHKGYPAAHLLATEGLLYRAEGNYTEAKKLFKEAVASRLNLTDAEKNLTILNSIKKTP